eukprot:Gb_09457 [translate_table: standard]
MLTSRFNCVESQAGEQSNTGNYDNMNLMESEEKEDQIVFWAHTSVQGTKATLATNTKTTDHDNSNNSSTKEGCASLKAMPDSKLVYIHIILTGFDLEISLESKPVITYTKCGSLADAKQNVISLTAITAYARHVYGKAALMLFYRVQQAAFNHISLVLPTCMLNVGALRMHAFDKIPEWNVVSWNGMIAGYAQNGVLSRNAVAGVKPNAETFATVLPACVNWASLHEGKEIHKDRIRNGFQPNVFLGSTLVDMYAKCGSIEDARIVFAQIPRRDEPNSDIFASVLSACTNLAAVYDGKELHEDIIRSGCQYNVFVGIALVDMDAKRSCIEDVCVVFETIPGQNVVSWNAMIGGYAQNGHVGYAMHGCGKEAVQHFQEMQLSSTKPDHVTFVGVLFDFCDAGLMNDGWQYFNCMNQDYHITLTIEYYCCMVHLLGHAGHLDKAQDFINKCQ